MSKLVVLKFIDGDFERGFKVSLMIGEEGNLPFTETVGYLPPEPILVSHFQNWQKKYSSLGAYYRILTVKSIYQCSSTYKNDFFESASKLQYCLRNWLQSREFREIDIRLREELNRNEQIRILIRTQDYQLRKLPWHLWDFIEDYPKAEFALSSIKLREQKKYNAPTYRDKVRILAILGNSIGIDVEKERQILAKLPDATTTFLVEPQRRDINEHLWNQSWDILFFAGHSSTETEKGRICINQTNSLTIEELKYALKNAVDNGLQLAIFNSCDGLGLAYELEKLHIPQIIVMREQVPDEVAQEFLRHFLLAFAAAGKSLYQATKEARLRLQGLEDKYPCASWLPVIYQNTTTVPPSWLDLGRRTTQICPYKGLLAFREEDAQFFFGRETFIKQLVEAVQKSPLVTVVGQSGSGKSSVVFAGLVKHLRNTNRWNIISFRPSDRPFQALATAIVNQKEPHLNRTDRLHSIRNLAIYLRQHENALRDVVDDIVKEESSKRLLLVADQLEELYTLCFDVQERKAFLDRLIETTKNCGNYFTVVITLRADFWGEALSYRPFADVLQHQISILSPMNATELRVVVENPAGLLGVKIEEGLVERILDAVSGEPGNLPLLEFALTQLWEKRQDAQLTHAAYEKIGGIEAALACYAEEVYNRLSEPEKERTQKIFTQLVRPGEGTEDTRRVATRLEVSEENWDLVTRLADARLVVTGYDDEISIETVEIVHEVLIRTWKRLHMWIQINRSFRDWQEQLRVAIRSWKNSYCDEGALLRGLPLTVAEDWLQKRLDELSPVEESFIKLSWELREREATQHKRRQQLTISRLTSGLVVALMLAGTAMWQWQRAKFQILNAEIKDLSASSREHFDSNQQMEALIEALKAGQQLQQLDKAAVYTRMQVVTSLEQSIYQVKERNRLKENSGWIMQVQFSPDGKMIASVKQDNTVKLWSREGKLLNTIESYSYKINSNSYKIDSISFSPDSKIIASGSNHGTVRLWDTNTGREIKTLRGHTSEVLSVSFSPDGKTLASGSNYGTVRLWDTNTGREIKTLRGHTSEVLSVSFSPDGKTLASADHSGNIKLWNINGTLTRTLRQNNSPVESISFSPDAQLIASADADKTIRLWKLDGTLLTTLRGHNDIVYSVNFSPDGQTIASASDDRTVKLWRRDGMLIKTLRGHSDGVIGVSFSPDGKLLASGSKDSTVILWNLDLDDLLARGCNFVRDYLKKNPNLEVQVLCDNKTISNHL